jgi:hypothetical protein
LIDTQKRSRKIIDQPIYYKLHHPFSAGYPRSTMFACWIGSIGPIFFSEVPELQPRGSSRSQSGGLRSTKEDDALWPLGWINPQNDAEKGIRLI